MAISSAEGNGGNSRQRRKKKKELLRVLPKTTTPPSAMSSAPASFFSSPSMPATEAEKVTKPIGTRFLDFVEHPLFTTPVFAIGSIVGVVFYAPFLVVSGICIVLAFHRAKVVQGEALKLQVLAYAIVFCATSIGLYGIGRLIRNHIPNFTSSTEIGKIVTDALRDAPQRQERGVPQSTVSRTALSQSQFIGIKQLDDIFAGLDDGELQEFFGFREMVYLNTKMYADRIAHFHATGNTQFDISPYQGDGYLTIETSVAGNSMRSGDKGLIYDFPIDQTALLIVPAKYVRNKKLLLRYEQSADFPKPIAMRVKELDDTLQANESTLARVMDTAIKENPDYFQDAVNSPGYNVISKRYWSQFIDLGNKVEKIREACRNALDSQLQ